MTKRTGGGKRDGHDIPDRFKTFLISAKFGGKECNNVDPAC